MKHRWLGPWRASFDSCTNAAVVPRAVPLKMNETVADYGNPPRMSSAALWFGFHRGAHTWRGRPETARVVSTIMIRNRLLRSYGNTAAITCPAGRSRP